MFKWLANLIIKTPIQGTCSCCEGKKERLRQMQKVILNEENPNPEIDEASSCSGCCSCAAPEANPYEGLNLSSSMQGRFEFNQESGTFKRTVEYSSEQNDKSAD